MRARGNPCYKPRISSGDIPNSMRCCFQCSHHPGENSRIQNQLLHKNITMIGGRREGSNGGWVRGRHLKRMKGNRRGGDHLLLVTLPKKHLSLSPFWGLRLLVNDQLPSNWWFGLVEVFRSRLPTTRSRPSNLSPHPPPKTPPLTESIPCLSDKCSS